MGDSYTTRLRREKEFHDRRFADGDNREAQIKYYWAVSRGARRFSDDVLSAAAGADVLEYGCGNGQNTERIGSVAQSLMGIDISEAAILRAKSGTLRGNVRYKVMDAMNLEFADASFDLVFGSGIIHHLDTHRAAMEIARVLRPGGRAIFWEPLGLNPAINLYRALTPQARTLDEHPLLPLDFRILRESFPEIRVSFFGLTTLAAVPFRNTRAGQSLLGICSALDGVLLSLPGVRNLAWYSLFTCSLPPGSRGDGGGKARAGGSSRG